MIFMFFSYFFVAEKMRQRLLGHPVYTLLGIIMRSFLDAIRIDGETYFIYVDFNENADEVGINIE